MSSDFVVALELVAENAVQKWRQLLGPTNCQVARAEAPNSIRALFGTEGVRNAAHGSDGPGSAQRECDFFFGEKSKLRAACSLNNCTCCVVKPHLIEEKKMGVVLDWILGEGFEIAGIQMFYLDRPTAEEFFEVYKVKDAYFYENSLFFPVMF
jgi:nucleoside-diphosphate kinase